MNRIKIAKRMTVGFGVVHPDGRLVLVTSGCFLDPIHGRVSNFWHWREILEGGKLGVDECGYGWQVKW